MFLGTSDNRREVLGIRAAKRVMETDEAAATFDVRVEVGLLLVGHVSGVTFVHDEHIGIRQIGRRGKLQRAHDARTVIRQHLAPVRQKLRIVVLAFAVGLETRADEDTDAVGIRDLRRTTTAAAAAAARSLRRRRARGTGARGRLLREH